MEFDFKGKRVLITGGTGFIGGNLVERLLRDTGAEVRVLVRNFAKAARIARFSEVEMMAGDVTRAEDVERAAEGCDIVVNCAYGNSGSPEEQRDGSVGGTRHVMEAAKKAPDMRVVHLSTVSVYGDTPDGTLDETAPRQETGDNYSDYKLESEREALRYARDHGVKVAVVQPTIVYGPFGPAWTTRILGDLKRGRVILVNGGDGLCNPVYIDDLVNGILLAATKEQAIGEVFLLSGEEPVTWREFYGAYEEMLGFESTVSMSADDAVGFFNGILKGPSLFKHGLRILREESGFRHRVTGSREGRALKRVVKLVAPSGMRRSIKSSVAESSNGASGNASAAPQPVAERKVLPMPPGAVTMHAAKTRVSIDKAKRLLGYAPAVDFAEGMRRTKAWAEWANLLTGMED